jgi:hypothetical protein
VCRPHNERPQDEHVQRAQQQLLFFVRSRQLVSLR